MGADVLIDTTMLDMDMGTNEIQLHPDSKQPGTYKSFHGWALANWRSCPSRQFHSLCKGDLRISSHLKQLSAPCLSYITCTDHGIMKPKTIIERQK